MFNQMLAMLAQMPFLYHVVGQGFGVPFLFSDLGLAPLEKLLAQMRAAHGDGDQLVHLGLYSLGGIVHFYKGELDEALRNGRTARRLIKKLGNLAWQSSSPNFVELNVLLAQGDYAALHRFCEEQTARIATDRSIAFTVIGFQFAQGMASWHQGQLDALVAMAGTLAEKYRIDLDEVQALPEQVEQTAYLPFKGTVLLLIGWAAIAQKQFDKAQRYFLQVLDIHRKYRHTFLGCHPRLALACLHWLWHQESGELAQLAEAEQQLALLLDEAAARGNARPVVAKRPCCYPCACNMPCPNIPTLSCFRRRWMLLASQISFAPFLFPTATRA